jgi:hypothetical protein
VSQAVVVVVTHDDVVLPRAHHLVQTQLRPVPMNAVRARGVAQDVTLGQRAGPILLLASRFAAIPRFEDLFLFVVKDRTPGASVVLPRLDLSQDGIVWMLLGGVKDLPNVVQGLNVVHVHEELRGIFEEGDLVGYRGL